MSINISPEQKHKLAKWWVLKQLRYLFLSGPHEMVIKYNFNSPRSLEEPEPEVQKTILEQLEMTGTVIKILKKTKTYYTIEHLADFYKTYDKYKKIAEGIDVLSSEMTVFDDDTATIILGNSVCQLPPFKSEHILCQVMYRYKVGESVDSSYVFESMKGDGEVWDDKSQRMIKDTILRINKRVSEVIGIPGLFKREQQTIRRLR